MVLDKARHDDEDDVDENMNNHFLDIMRTSLMTCLRLLVGFRWYVCRAEIPSEEARTVLPDIMNARRNRRTNSSLFRNKTACILSHMTRTGNFEGTSSQRLNSSKGAVSSARFVATL